MAPFGNLIFLLLLLSRETTKSLNYLSHINPEFNSGCEFLANKLKEDGSVDSTGAIKNVDEIIKLNFFIIIYPKE